MAGIPDAKFLTLPTLNVPFQPPAKVTGTHVLHMDPPRSQGRPYDFPNKHHVVRLERKVSDPNRDSSFGSNNKKNTKPSWKYPLGCFVATMVSCNSWQHHLSTPWQKMCNLMSFCQWQLDLKSYQKLGKCLGYFRYFGVESALFWGKSPWILRLSQHGIDIHWICPTQ